MAMTQLLARQNLRLGSSTIAAQSIRCAARENPILADRLACGRSSLFRRAGKVSSFASNPTHLRSFESRKPAFMEPSGLNRRTAQHSKTSMQATGTDTDQRIVTPAEEAASRLGVNGADFLNDPDKERGRTDPVPDGIHPSVQLLIDVLKEEMPKFFSESGINLTIYRDDVHFQDPQNNWHTLFGFKVNVWALRTFFFKGRYLLHDIAATGKDEITARWTFDLPARFLPWTPTVILTGITKYGVDLEQAKFNAHIDYWDNLVGKQQKPVSLAAIGSVIKQIQPLTAFNIPRDSPHEVIRKTKHYEIRQYAQDLRDPSQTDMSIIAVQRSDEDLIRILKKDGIKVESEQTKVRTLQSGWPHKEIKEVYVPVSYRPSVYDVVDFTGAEYWKVVNQSIRKLS